jgi:hypothetical protein
LTLSYLVNLLFFVPSVQLKNCLHLEVELKPEKLRMLMFTI